MQLNFSDPSVGAVRGVCPMTVLEQDFQIGTQYVLKGKSDTDPGISGNFGWINLDPSQPGNKSQNIADWLIGPDSPSISLPCWIGGFTGQRNAAVIKSALSQLSNSYIVILVHDSHSGSGSSLQYHDVGMALFRLENFTEQSGSGQPYLEITGTFIKRLQ